MNSDPFSSRHSALSVLLLLLLAAACGGGETTPDAGDGGNGPDASDAGEDDHYLANCGSLFASRILEMQRERTASFPADCDAVLVDDIGTLASGPLCRAGESPNDCQARLYESPPALPGDLDPGCWTSDPPRTGCLRGKWLPPCADGGDTCAEPEAICQDGTRPMVYAEAATAGPSDVWIIYQSGEGGPCVGDICWASYRYGMDDAAFPKAMSSLHPEGPSKAAEIGAGIMSGDPDPANPFARANRVHFERCADAASDAVEMVPVGDGVIPELAERYADAPIRTRSTPTPLWHHGFKIWSALFHALATKQGRDLDGDGAPDLPSIADATTVVLVGSSDASTWLIHAADALAGVLRDIAGRDVDVRLVIDGYFNPSLDNEGRYHPAAPADFNLLTHPYTITGLCELPDNGDSSVSRACSEAYYRPGVATSPIRDYRGALDTRGVVSDETCEATHGAGAWECADRSHLLFQHLQTPVFILADQEDHTVSGVTPPFVEDYRYVYTLSDYRRRVLDQARDLRTYVRSVGGEEGPGSPNHFSIVLPKRRRDGEPPARATHVRMGSDTRMAEHMTQCDEAGNALASPTLAELIARWMMKPPESVFVVESAADWGGSGNFWVTGPSCRAPE